MPTKLEIFNQLQLKKELPDIRSGDTVRVFQKIPAFAKATADKKEGDKEKIQVFEGVVIARKHGKGISSTITVRRVIGGIGMEKIYPLHSPVIEKIEVLKRGKTRRAKLYYLREAKGKRAKLKRKEFVAAIAEEKPEEALEEAKEEEKTIEEAENELKKDEGKSKK